MIQSLSVFVLRKLPAYAKLKLTCNLCMADATKVIKVEKGITRLLHFGYGPALQLSKTQSDSSNGKMINTISSSSVLERQ